MYLHNVHIPKDKQYYHQLSSTFVSFELLVIHVWKQSQANISPHSSFFFFFIHSSWLPSFSLCFSFCTFFTTFLWILLLEQAHGKLFFFISSKLCYHSPPPRLARNVVGQHNHEHHVQWVRRWHFKEFVK